MNGYPEAVVPATAGMGMGMGPMEDTGAVSEAIPSQEGIAPPIKEGTIGSLMFDDMFPDIVLTDAEKEPLVVWFERDLRSCVRNVNRHRSEWAKYRAVYMLEYTEKYYPDMGIGADYASGLLLEKMLEGMDRLKRSIFKARPLFIPDSKMTGSDASIDMEYRAMWALHTYLVTELKVEKKIRESVIFDFLIDGSAIVEADMLYEVVPQRVLRTYTSADDLVSDMDKVVDSARYEQALMEINTKGMARVLVEDDVVTKSGMQLFHVDKVDHLVPEKVHSDDDMRFRARRMYLTTSDLKLLASEDVGWYDPRAVDKVVAARQEKRTLKQVAARGGDGAGRAREELSRSMENSDLSYDWSSEDDRLSVTPGTQPYEDVFAVYRITCKYGYTTGSDPKGDIPKFCVFDYSPEGKVILRAKTYPHYEERPNWFHFKLGTVPKSYYGYGFGKRVVQDDFLESNAVDLFMDSAALASFNPFVAKHPDAGGIGNPFMYGFGPGKIGYANDPKGDLQQFVVRPPSDSLLRHILPLTQTRSGNRTSVTSLVQGRTESTDPRSPAQKTAMLLEQATLGIDVMVDDWNKSGWNDLAMFVWEGMYEIASYMLTSDSTLTKVLDGLVVKDQVPPDAENIISLDELHKRIEWISMASSDYLNPEIRGQRFMRQFSFFTPMLKELAAFNPELYKKYFLRWMRRAAQESDVPGMGYLLPTAQELATMPVDKLGGVMDAVLNRMSSGQAPWVQNAQGGRTEQ